MISWLFWREIARPTHEEVVGVGDVATDSEQLHQVVELAVDISAYLFPALTDRHFEYLERRPPTVTGADTVTTFPSSIKSSLALWQSSRTWASGIGRHERSCAIALIHSDQLHSNHRAANRLGRLLVQVAHVL